MGIFDFLKQKKENIKVVIEYLPNIGILINSIELKWNSDRKGNRKKLKLNFKDDDQLIDVSEYFDGDKSTNIRQIRDIYNNCFSDYDMFILHYNENNKLKEIEVHFGYEIRINEIKLEFGNNITEYLKEFTKKGFQYSEIESGNYLLEKLKITIANSDAMGGDGKGLSYFYGTSEIKHLID